MKKVFKMKTLVLVLALIAVPVVYAQADGTVTKNLMDVFSNVGSMFSGICLVVGIGLIFASFIQYRQHRANKLLVPISKPIVLLILGIFLACIPLLGHYTQGGQLISQVGAQV